MSSVIWSISRARLLDERGDVLAGKRRRLEQREEPRERRAELVRDRSGEARAQLLVRGKVALAREVDETLAPTAHLVRNDERDDAALAGQEVRRERARPRGGRRPPAARAGSRAARDRRRRGRRSPRGSPRRASSPGSRRRPSRHTVLTERLRIACPARIADERHSPLVHQTVTISPPPRPSEAGHYGVAGWRRS